MVSVQVEEYSSAYRKKANNGKKKTSPEGSLGLRLHIKVKTVRGTKHLSPFQCLPYTRMDSYWLIIFHIIDKTNKANPLTGYNS